MSYGRFKFRRDTAANWTSVNPVLATGEMALEVGVFPYKYKIGNGADAWTALPYGGTTGPAGTTAWEDITGKPAWVLRPLIIPIAVSDETTALTAGVAKVTFRMPCAMTLVAVRASLTTAQASGNIFTVDVNEGGASILSAKLTIDNAEKTSATAEAPVAISDVNLADDAEITVDIDQVGNGTASGLKVYLIGCPA